jgi:hypothetical protein
MEAHEHCLHYRIIIELCYFHCKLMVAAQEASLLSVDRLNETGQRSLSPG